MKTAEEEEEKEEEEEDKYYSLPTSPTLNYKYLITDNLMRINKILILNTSFSSFILL